MLALPPELVWGIFTRLLGGVYLVALAPLWWQIVPFAGERGCAPLAPLLARIRRDFPWHARVRYFPTLFWLSSSPAMLRGVVALGCLAACAAIYGGPWTPLALFICFATLLSTDMAVYLVYPWDHLLLEAGFLALLLPPLQPLPRLAATGEPAPLVAFAFQLLLVRVLMGFGKYKFIGHTRQDSLYLHGFLVNAAFPLKLGWYAHHLPPFFHRAGLVWLAVSELLLPPLVLLPGPVRLLPLASSVALMAAISATGNFGYFNLLVLVLCVPLLDLGTSLAQVRLDQIVGSPVALATHLLVLVLIVGAVLYFPFNSWCTRTWLHWPVLLGLRSRALRALLSFYRALAPFGLLHAYGVFSPQSTPGLRFVPVLEGSLDGDEWREYGYRCMPTTETSPPRIVAPWHPRLDHLLVYEGYGINTFGFMSTTLGPGLPYLFSPVSLTSRLMRSLTQPGSPLLSLLGSDPFHGTPPRLVRMSLYALEPVSIAEHRATGRWWHRYKLGMHLPPVDRDALGADTPPPGPELFHWDDVIWRRRTPLMRRFEQAAVASRSLEEMEAAVAQALDVSQDTLDRFWGEFIPGIPFRGAESWDGITELARTTRDRFGDETMRDFERVAALLAIGLAARLDDRLTKPTVRPLPWPVISYFHVGMLLYALIAHRRETFESAFRDEAFLETQARRLTDAAGLWLFGIFRTETLAFQARAARLVEQFAPIRWAPGSPGFSATAGFLARQFLDPGGERRLVLTRRLRDGAWEAAWPDPATPTISAQPSQPGEVRA